MDWLAFLASKFSTEGKEKNSGGIKWEEFINNVQSPFKRRTEQNVDSVSTAPSWSIFYCFFFKTMFFKQHTATRSYSEAGVSAQKKTNTQKNQNHTAI